MGNMTETSFVLSDNKNAENSGASKKHHLAHLQLADFPTQQQVGQSPVVRRQDIRAQVSKMNSLKNKTILLTDQGGSYLALSPPASSSSFFHGAGLAHCRALCLLRAIFINYPILYGTRHFLFKRGTKEKAITLQYRYPFDIKNQ